MAWSALRFAHSIPNDEGSADSILECFVEREREFMTRQPPRDEKIDYERRSFWMSGGLPSSRRRRQCGRRRGRGEGGLREDPRGG